MISAASAAEIEERRRAFMRKWRLKCCGRFSVAVANFRRSKPSDGHSIANDLATNTSDGARAEAEGEPRAAAGALAEWHSARVRRERYHPTPVLRGL
jgi:hypothetical protein